MKNIKFTLALVSTCMLAVSACSTGSSTMSVNVPVSLKAKEGSKTSSTLEKTWKQAAGKTEAAANSLQQGSDRTKKNLVKMFLDDSPATQAAVLKTIRKMENAIKTGKVELVLEDRAGWKAFSERHHMQGRIILAVTRQYGHRADIVISEEGFNEFRDERLTTLLHELSHAAAQTKDHAYINPDGSFAVGAKQYDHRTGSSTQVKAPANEVAKRIENADSIAKFILLEARN